MSSSQDQVEAQSPGINTLNDGELLSPQCATLKKVGSVAFSPPIQLLSSEDATTRKKERLRSACRY